MHCIISCKEEQVFDTSRTCRREDRQIEWLNLPQALNCLKDFFDTIPISRSDQSSKIQSGHISRTTLNIYFNEASIQQWDCNTPPSASVRLDKAHCKKRNYFIFSFDPSDIKDEKIRTDIVTAFNAFAKKFLNSKSYRFSPKLVFLPVPADIISRPPGAL